MTMNNDYAIVHYLHNIYGLGDSVFNMIFFNLIEEHIIAENILFCYFTKNAKQKQNLCTQTIIITINMIPQLIRQLLTILRQHHSGLIFIFKLQWGTNTDNGHFLAKYSNGVLISDFLSLGFGPHFWQHWKREPIKVFSTISA